MEAQRSGSGPPARRTDYLFWRLPLLVATLALVVPAAHSVGWALAVALPLATGMLAAFLFEPAVVERWLRAGHLLLADALLVALALAGTLHNPAPLLFALFAVVFAASVAGERNKTLLATAAFVSALLGVNSVAALGAFSTGPWLIAELAVLVAAALSFGTLAERMSGAPDEADSDARRETDALWALLEITEAIGGSLEPARVMRTIVQRVGDLVDSESCSILLAEERSGSCFVVASKGHPEVEMLEVDLRDYPEIRRALDTREPVYIEDVESHPLIADVRQILVDKGYRALLVLPLIFGREVLGALFLRARRERPFTAEELRFCKVAAGASANALKNASLYREVLAESERHRATGEKLRRLLDGSPDLIVATDLAGRVIEFNRGAESIVGRDGGQVVGRPLAGVLGLDPLAVAAAEGDTTPREFAFDRSDGERIDLNMVSAPLSGAEGEPAGRVWIGRDVTKLRRVEKSLAQAERLSSLGEVVAGVAHELNNPLSGVVGYAELLRAHAVDSGQIRDLDRIVESAMRCQKIVFKLLSFARKHKPEKRSHDLNQCVNKVLDLKSYHLRSSQIETVLELDSELVPTCFDFHQIEQVLLNLLNNAGQSIGSLRSPGTIRIRTGRTATSVYCEVEDSGPGVPEAVRGRVFDPFFTTKELGQGTGLGLSVSYGIVSEHGGNIELLETSDLGGARFRVTLPIVDGAPAESSPPDRANVEAGETSPLRGRSVLVAEDEPLVLELFSRLLSELGAEVTLAGDGREAWERLRERDFDLIVADLRMPEVDGRQLYELVARERPELLCRFVFATGDLVRQETVAFLEHLPNRILTKPLEVETVRRVLSQAIVGSRAAPVEKTRSAG